MNDIKSFNPSNDWHRFIFELNQAYTINVKPEFANYPDIEKESMKITKRLLERGIGGFTARHIRFLTTEIVSYNNP